jgi:hypothetical protein
MNIRTSLSAALALVLLASVGAQAKTAAPKVRDICLADFQKLCPTAKLARGSVMRCVKTRLDDVSPDCRAAVTAAKDKNAARKAAKLAAAQPSSKSSAH